MCMFTRCHFYLIGELSPSLATLKPGVLSASTIKRKLFQNQVQKLHAEKWSGKRRRGRWTGSPLNGKHHTAKVMFFAVFRIRNILRRIRIRILNLHLDPYTRLQIRIWIWTRILTFSSVAFKMPTKNNFFSSFFAYYRYFLYVHLHQSSKITSH